MTPLTRLAVITVELLVVLSAVAAGPPLLGPDVGTVTAQEGAQPREAFVVTGLDMPPIATPGWFNVTAEIRNPGEAVRTEDVAFRFEGGPHDIVVHRRLTVPGNSTRQVSFSLNTTGFEPDRYIAGVTTANSSELDRIELSTTAEIDLDPQETNGTAVVVDSVFLPRGGYVVIHNGSLERATAVESVIGTSAYLPTGFHEAVTVRLFDVPGARFETDRLTADGPIVAMAHQETSQNRTFNFVTSNGRADGPFLHDDEPVAEAANVTVVPTNESGATGAA